MIFRYDNSISHQDTVLIPTSDLRPCGSYQNFMKTCPRYLDIPIYMQLH